eukprot:m.135134 g.135134  ORF g.135134 m.135134 type:complete len:338 (-) comp9881_c0_seq5:184-1197(-)
MPSPQPPPLPCARVRAFLVLPSPFHHFAVFRHLILMSARCVDARTRSASRALIVLRLLLVWKHKAPAPCPQWVFFSTTLSQCPFVLSCGPLQLDTSQPPVARAVTSFVVFAVPGRNPHHVVVLPLHTELSYPHTRRLFCPHSPPPLREAALALRHRSFCDFLFHARPAVLLLAPWRRCSAPCFIRSPVCASWCCVRVACQNLPLGTELPRLFLGTTSRVFLSPRKHQFVRLVEGFWFCGSAHLHHTSLAFSRSTVVDSLLLRARAFFSPAHLSYACRCIVPLHCCFAAFLRIAPHFAALLHTTPSHRICRLPPGGLASARVDGKAEERAAERASEQA